MVNEGDSASYIEEKIKEIEEEIRGITERENKLLSESEMLKTEIEEKQKRIEEKQKKIEELEKVASSKLKVKENIAFILFLLAFSLLIFLIPLCFLISFYLSLPFYFSFPIIIVAIFILFIVSIILYPLKPDILKTISLEVHDLNRVQAEYHEKLRRYNYIRSELNEIKSQKALLEKDLEMLRKGLIPFVDMFGVKKYGTPQQVRKWKIMEMDMKNHFAALTPRQFEILIMKLFEAMGYKTHLTSYVKDYGADIIAEKGSERIVVQVKKYTPKQKVGSPDIQRLLGSMIKYKANKAIFITTSDYTKEAQDQAEGTPAELWNYNTLCRKIEEYLLNSTKP